MKCRDMWSIIVVTVVLLVLTSSTTATSATTQPGEAWVHVQNASQDYAFDCPVAAQVRRYEPDGVLHVVLPTNQVMMVSVRDDLTYLDTRVRNSMSESEIKDVLQAALETYKMHGRIQAVHQTSIAGKWALVTEYAGGLQPYRLVLLFVGHQVLSITYPIGVPENTIVFAEIVKSIDLTESATDRGIEVVTPTPSTINSIPVPVYYQNDNQWVCDQLGNCVACPPTLPKWACPSQPAITTIGDAGCTVTSYAMIFEYYTPSHFMTPLELDTCYTVNGEYGSISGCGYCGRHWWNLNQSVCKPGDVTYIGETHDQGVVDADLAAGHPLMGQLPGHYVVVVGKNGSNYQVNDPVIGNPSERAWSAFETFVRFRGPIDTNPPPEPPPSNDCLKPLLRYWNNTTRRHFYTSTWAELGGGSGEWVYELFEGYVAVDGNCYAPGAVPFYRMWHETRRKHFYTASESERDYAVHQLGFVLESASGHLLLQPNDTLHTLPLYRCYSASQDDHFYTTDWSAVEAAQGYGYLYESIAGYIFSPEALVPHVPVNAGFVGSPVKGMTPLLVSFTNQSTGEYTTCTWTFGDGGTSSSCGNPTHTYVTDGLYTVKLTVSGLGGTDTATRTAYIEVMEKHQMYLPLCLRRY